MIWTGKMISPELIAAARALKLAEPDITASAVKTRLGIEQSIPAVHRMIYNETFVDPDYHPKPPNASLHLQKDMRAPRVGSPRFVAPEPKPAPEPSKASIDCPFKCAKCGCGFDTIEEARACCVPKLASVQARKET